MDVETELRQGIAAVLSATSHEAVLHAAHRYPSIATSTGLEVLMGIAERQTELTAAQSVLRICWTILPFIERVVAGVRKRGDEASAGNVEGRMFACETDLAHLAQKYDPGSLPYFSSELADRYRKRSHGDRSANLERALALYSSALSFLDSETNPHEWANICISFAITYYSRRDGDQFTNLTHAVSLLEHALTKYTRTEEPVAWARAQNNLGIIYSKLDSISESGDFDERAISAFENALSILTRNVDEEAWASAVNNLGGLYVNLQSEDRTGNILRAVTLFKDALTVRTIARDPVTWAETSDNLGNAYLLAGSQYLDVALVHLRNAAGVFENSPADPRWGRVCANLGQALHDRCVQGRLDVCEEAILWLERATAALIPEHDGNRWAKCYLCLGDVYSLRGMGSKSDNVEAAIAHINNGLARVRREDDGWLWSALRSALGVALLERRLFDHAENVEAAMDCFQTAVAALAKEGMQLEHAMLRRNLGNAFRHRLKGDRADNIERAIAEYREALTLLTRESHPREWAVTVGGLGQAYAERLRGDDNENRIEATNCFLQALEVLTPDDGEAWANTNNNLGSVLAESGSDSDQERALLFFLNALSKRSKDKDAAGWTQTTNNLALLLLRRSGRDPAENVERAIGYFNELLVVRTRDTDIRGWMNTTINLAEAYSRRVAGDRHQNLERTVALTRSVASEVDLHFLPRRALEASLLEARTLMQIGPERWTEAAVALKRAEEVFARAAESAITREAKRHVLSRMSRVGQWLALIAVSKSAFDEALEQLESWRAVGLRKSLQVESLSGPPGQETPMLRWRRQIEALFAEAAQVHTAHHDRTFSAIVDEIRHAEVQLADALASTGFREAVALPARSLLGAIPTDAILVAPVATEFGSFAFVIPGGTQSLSGQHVVALPQIAEAELNEQIQKLFMAVVPSGAASAPNQIGISQRRSEMDNVLNWLGERVMEALLPAIRIAGDTNSRPEGLVPHVIILPTGAFSLFPLHAAPCRVGEKHTILLDEFAVSYVPSLHALSIGRHREAQRAGSAATLVGIINPTNDLRFSEEIELPALQNVFSGDSTTFLIGQNATKRKLRQNTVGATHVHFACHGQFDWGNPYASGLKLSNGEMLTLPDITASLDLTGCRLAVLASCETGITDIQQTPEEALGPATAFFEAGAACIIGALWSVSDLASALFAQRVYEVHIVRGLPPAHAAREASLWLRTLSREEVQRWAPATAIPNVESAARGFPVIGETRSDLIADAAPPFVHPFYWASFATWGA